MTEIYDSIGKNYSLGRRTDPQIAAQIHAHLMGADCILNIGAGAGSYEPKGMRGRAVEPSWEMISQRPPDAFPVTKARAEALPFADQSFSHTMTVLSMHHWPDRPRAFQEIRRVTRKRFVAVTWDPASTAFWLTRDYFPEIAQLDAAIFPEMTELAAAFPQMTTVTLKIPANCIDGFLGAYWRRPEAYLDPQVRARMSTFARISRLDEGIEQLRHDLSNGSWVARNGYLLTQDHLDVGYRLLIADL